MEEGQKMDDFMIGWTFLMCGNGVGFLGIPHLLKGILIVAHVLPAESFCIVTP